MSQREISALEGLTRPTTARLLHEALSDLAKANARIERLQHAMMAVEAALTSKPEADAVDLGLAHVLATARGVR